VGSLYDRSRRLPTNPVTGSEVVKRPPQLVERAPIHAHTGKRNPIVGRFGTATVDGVVAVVNLGPETVVVFDDGQQP